MLGAEPATYDTPTAMGVAKQLSELISLCCKGLKMLKTTTKHLQTLILLTHYKIVTRGEKTFYFTG